MKQIRWNDGFDDFGPSSDPYSVFWWVNTQMSPPTKPMLSPSPPPRLHLWVYPQQLKEQMSTSDTEIQVSRYITTCGI